jgi:TonB family protein
MDSRARMTAGRSPALALIASILWISCTGTVSRASDEKFSIEGDYVGSQNAVIEVRRLFGDFYRIVSVREGWQSVIVLDSTGYEGVLQQAYGDGRPGVVGHHHLEWRDADHVQVHGSLAGTDFDQQWIRASEIPKSERPPGMVVSGTGSFNSRDRDWPDFGDFVYVSELPEAITRVPPVYPDEARAAGVSGTVLIQALIKKDGTVGDAFIRKPVAKLNDAAIACIWDWRFKPATCEGKPVAVWVAIPIKFSLH